MSSRAAASVTAVVAAAGSGERLGAGGPKAFVPLGGRPMVEWSIDALRATEAVGSIVVACPPGGGRDLGRHDVGLVDGGETRAESVANALAAVETELVAIHDAARPLLTPSLVEGVIATLGADPEADGAIAAAPVTDTIKRASAHLPTHVGRRPRGSPHSAVVDPTVSVGGTVNRAGLWAAQTPQAFRTEALRRAIAAYPEDAPPATDEAMLVEASGGKVLIHPASPENLKVTTPLDLRLAELLLAVRQRPGEG